MAEILSETITKKNRWDAVVTARDCNMLPSQADTVTKFYHSCDWTETKLGSKNPRYKSQIKNCTQAGTAYNADRRKVQFRPGSLTRVYKSKCTLPDRTNRLKIVGSDGTLANPFFGVLPTSSAGAQNAAKAGFLKEAKAVRQKMMGMVYLKEWKAAVRGIVSPFKGLQAAIRSYGNRLASRKNSFRNRKESEKFLSATWLEYSFGFAPMLSDIRSGAEALAEIKMRNGFKSVPISGYGAARSFLQNFGNSYGYGVSYLDEFNTFGEISYRYVGSMATSCTYPGTPTHLLEQLGFSISEFIPTVWEVIPFSFLVDYFSNVGQMINSVCTSTSGIQWIVLTKRTKVTVDKSGKPVAFQPGYDYVAVANEWTTERTVIERTPLSNDVDNFVPTFEFQFPGLYQTTIIASLGDQFNLLTPYLPQNSKAGRYRL